MKLFVTEAGEKRPFFHANPGLFFNCVGSHPHCERKSVHLAKPDRPGGMGCGQSTFSFRFTHRLVGWLLDSDALAGAARTLMAPTPAVNNRTIAPSRRPTLR